MASYCVATELLGLLGTSDVGVGVWVLTPQLCGLWCCEGEPSHQVQTLLPTKELGTACKHMVQSTLVFDALCATLGTTHIENSAGLVTLTLSHMSHTLHAMYFVMPGSARHHGPGFNFMRASGTLCGPQPFVPRYFAGSLLGDKIWLLFDAC